MTGRWITEKRKKKFRARTLACMLELSFTSLDASKSSESILCKSGRRSASADATDATAGVAVVAVVVAVAAMVACRASQHPLARPWTMLKTSRAASWYRLRH